MTNVNEFLRESRRIDQLIWDAMSLVEGERVLFCGSANDAAWIRRAIEVGVRVTVIDSDAQRLEQLADIDVTVIRGSTTMIPARSDTFDAVVAFHYLHEIDPTFHAQTMFELARVAKRIVVVEPAPPSDLFGKRIAELYSRAKFEAGAFEEYQQVDYWRKLLAIVKADVVVQQFTFTRIAPRFLISDTIDLILDAMAISDMPQPYIDELRDLARRTDTQLSPLSRYVLVAVAGGEEARTSAGTLFRPVEEQPDPVATPEPAHAAGPPGTGVPALPAVAAAAAAAAAAGAADLSHAEFPPIIGPSGETIATGAPPPAVPLPAPPQPAPFIPAAAMPPGAAPFAPLPASGIPAPPPPAQPLPPPPAAPAFGLPPGATPGAPPPPPSGIPFGLPDEDEDVPFGVPPPAGPGGRLGTPFALPEDPDPFGLEADPERRPGGWSWEPPEDDFGPPR